MTGEQFVRALGALHDRVDGFSGKAASQVLHCIAAERSRLAGATITRSAGIRRELLLIELAMRVRRLECSTPRVVVGQGARAVGSFRQTDA
ncbi:MAG: hypothetical protein V3T70_06935 [Phycisphaerae bacterium]